MKYFFTAMSLLFMSAWFWAYFSGSDELSSGAALGLIWSVFPLAIRSQK